MLGAEKPLTLNLHGELEEPGKDRPDILCATLNQLFHQTVERRIVPLVHSWISIVFRNSMEYQRGIALAGDAPARAHSANLR